MCTFQTYARLRAAALSRTPPATTDALVHAVRLLTRLLPMALETGLDVVGSEAPYAPDAAAACTLFSPVPVGFEGKVGTATAASAMHHHDADEAVVLARYPLVQQISLVRLSICLAAIIDFNLRHWCLL
jgi:hypothetical protein